MGNGVLFFCCFNKFIVGNSEEYWILWISCFIMRKEFMLYKRVYRLNFFFNFKLSGKV